MEVYREITECGLCKSPDLEEYLNLGFSPLANGLKENPTEKEIESPLKVVKCLNRDCECFQLDSLVNPEILFKNYNYRSSNGLDVHFKDYAQHTFKLLGLKEKDLMVGIGGNIGFLELAYKNLGMDVINIEPSNIAEESRKNGIVTFRNFFDADVVKRLILEVFGKAKVICGNNVLAHCDLDPIMDGIKLLLDKNGYLIIEAAYWLNSVENFDIFQIYAEHYKYLSIKPLQQFFDSHGFDLWRVEFNNIQCGSFRAYIKWKQNNIFPIDKSVEEAIQNEEKFGLYHEEVYEDLLLNLAEVKRDINKLLSVQKAQGKRFGIFGVAAKTVLLLKYFGIAEYFDLATDDAENKWNKFIPGTSIKIVPKDEFWAEKFDYVLPIYNFFENIVSANRDKNCQWIRILPYIGVV